MKAIKSLCLLFCFVILGGIFLQPISINRQALALAEQTESTIYDEIDSYLANACYKAHFPAMSITIVNKEDVLLSKIMGIAVAPIRRFYLALSASHSLHFV